MSIHDKRDLAFSLAKENHGDQKYAALWGAAAVLLSEKDLDVIIKVMEMK
jgi:hypothetical protein